MKQGPLRLLLMVLASLAAGGFILSKVWILPEMPAAEERPQANPKTMQQQVMIGKSVIQAEIRRTPAEQELGLSWRASLGPNEGMVFVYPELQKVMYWMKGMQFPLDFLWVAGGKVVQITEGVQAPDSANRVPKTVVPVMEVDTVIEVNSGWATAHGIMVGDAVGLAK